MPPKASRKSANATGSSGDKKKQPPTGGKSIAASPIAGQGQDPGRKTTRSTVQEKRNLDKLVEFQNGEGDQQSIEAILKKLNAHIKDQSTNAWYFDKPVDPQITGCHDYYEKVKHPMCLETIKERLRTGWYYHYYAEIYSNLKPSWRILQHNDDGSTVVIDYSQLSEELQQYSREELIVRANCGSPSTIFRSVQQETGTPPLCLPNPTTGLPLFFGLRFDFLLIRTNCILFNGLNNEISQFCSHLCEWVEEHLLPMCLGLSLTLRSAQQIACLRQQKDNSAADNQRRSADRSLKTSEPQSPLEGTAGVTKNGSDGEAVTKRGKRAREAETEAWVKDQLKTQQVLTTTTTGGGTRVVDDEDDDVDIAARDERFRKLRLEVKLNLLFNPYWMDHPRVRNSAREICPGLAAYYQQVFPDKTGLLVDSSSPVAAQAPHLLTAEERQKGNWPVMPIGLKETSHGGTVYKDLLSIFSTLKKVMSHNDFEGMGDTSAGGGNNGQSFLMDLPEKEKKGLSAAEIKKKTRKGWFLLSK